MFKNLLFSLLYFFIGILIINLFLTVFSYFNLIGDNVINVLYFFLPLGLVLMCSYLLGKKSEKKGFLEGLKLGGIICLVFLFITFMGHEFSVKVFIYYIVIIITSIMGSSIGINNKEKNAK